MEKRMEMKTPSKYPSLGVAITAGFWFGVGVILADGVVDGLNHFVRIVTRGK